MTTCPSRPLTPSLFSQAHGRGCMYILCQFAVQFLTWFPIYGAVGQLQTLSFDFVPTPHSARAVAETKKKPAQSQGRPATAPAPVAKAPVAFAQWGLPQAAPPAAASSQSNAPGAVPRGPAQGAVPADKKKSGQSGSFPPMPSKAQQQVCFPDVCVCVCVCMCLSLCVSLCVCVCVVCYATSCMIACSHTFIHKMGNCRKVPVNEKMIVTSF